LLNSFKKELILMPADDDGLAVLIKPEAITAIHYARHSKPRYARRRKRVRR
jgi:hypothetical protein